MKLNKKKGFTLIELLAVIVVLAIIALIATPIVMNTIEKSKKGTVIESANNLIKSAEYYILQTKNRYGKVSVLNEKLNYTGNKPDLGEVEINKDGKSRIYTYLNGYCVTKDYENKSPYATKTSKEECNWFATDNYETTEGSIITINNGNIKNYLIYGNSTQETRSGKNLFDKNNYSQDSTNIVQFDITNLEIGKTYTFSSNIPITWFKISNARNGYGSVQYSNTDGFAKYTFTMSRNSNIASSATQYLYLGIKGLTFVDTISDLNNYNIQIEEGSSATEYEEYGAMPSPEFPSEINNTGDLITKDNCSSYGNDACDNIGKYVLQVKATGKNLFNINKMLSYATSSSGSNGTYTFVATSDMFYKGVKIPLKSGTTVTISGKVTNLSSGTNFRIDGIYTDGSRTNLSGFSGTGTNETKDISRTFTLTKDLEYITFDWSVQGQFKIENLQIEISGSATTYEPYREATTNIYLDEQLRKVGDTVDYIDYANGKVVRNIKSELVANKIWNYRADDDLIYYTDSNIMHSNYANSNYFLSGAQKTGINPYVLTVSNVFRLYNKNYWSSLDSYKTWLNNHKDLVVEYLLATPTEESISLPQIKTVEGTNYITVNTSTSASNLKITTEK